MNKYPTPDWLSSQVFAFIGRGTLFEVYNPMNGLKQCKITAKATTVLES